MKKLNLISCMATSVAFAAVMSAANVVTEWNTIAANTIVTNGGKVTAAATAWFAYSSIAVYDAVNSITNQYRPFYYHAAVPPGASVEAASAAAAHRVLVHFFPTQQADLDAKFEASLADIRDHAEAKEAGVAVGEASAAAVIAARTGDGLEANITYTPGSGAGAWTPTPPGFLAPAVPWLGQLRPFAVSTRLDTVLQGPTPLDKPTWRRDYNLTKMFGNTNSAVRSAEQTEIGLFWTDNPARQYARAFGYLADTYQLSVPETARLMAVLWTGYADSMIACFQGKYKYGFWRPVTAIQAGGASAGLEADPAWLPPAATPNHPEYPAAHGCATGTVSNLIAGYFGTTKVHIVTDSTVFPDGVHKHVIEDTRDLLDEVFWARIYSGFHFYHSLQDGSELGARVAHELLRNHFTRRRESELPSGEGVNVRR